MALFHDMLHKHTLGSTWKCKQANIIMGYRPNFCSCSCKSVCFDCNTISLSCRYQGTADAVSFRGRPWTRREGQEKRYQQNCSEEVQDYQIWRRFENFCLGLHVSVLCSGTGRALWLLLPMDGLELYLQIFGGGGGVFIDRSGHEKLNSVGLLKKANGMLGFCYQNFFFSLSFREIHTYWEGGVFL